MGRVEEAIIFATNKHNGQKRKIGNTPYIMHPLEVAQIIASITYDESTIIAGLLHDTVEDTDTTLDEIRDHFGDRVMELVSMETENKYREENPEETWQIRKEENLKKLKASKDYSVKVIWLADKLSNLRSMHLSYQRIGDDLWKRFNQKDPKMHEWYYRSVVECVASDLKNTDAFKEFTDRIDSMWDTPYYL